MEPPPPRRKKWLRRLVLSALALGALGALLWCGWYVYYRGFTRKWREELAAELRRRGLDFSAKRLTLNPFEGLVAEDARLYLLDEHHTPLLFINRVAVDIDLGALIRRQPFLNSLDLRGARLLLPVDMADPDGPKFKLRRFQAKLAFLPNEVRLTQAEGEFYRIHVSASGALLHPGSFSPGAAADDPAATARRRQLARSVIDEIQKVSADRAPPRVELRFQGDLAHPASLRASVQIHGEALRRGSYRLDRLLVLGDYSAGALHVQQVELADAHGTLAAQGDYNPGTGEAHFQLQSGLDLLALNREFIDPHALPDLTLRDPPRLQLEGRGRLLADPANKPGPAANSSAPALAAAPGWQLTGRLALSHFAFHSYEFDRGETDFSWNADRWYLRGLHLVRPGSGGQQLVTADLLSEPGQARLRASGNLDPEPFFDLLPTRGQSLLTKLEFHDLPHFELTATGPAFANWQNWKADGQLTLGRTRYRGQGINRLRTDLAYANGLLTSRKLSLERDEGSAMADNLVYEFAKHELRLDNVRCGLDPGTAGVWLDPDVYHTIQPFHFRKPPALVMNGVLQFDGGQHSHLVTDVSAPGGMDYVFVKKSLNFQDIAGQVVFTEDRLALNEVRGQIFGGEATGSLDLTLGHAGGHVYTAAIDLKSLDFQKLTRLYFDYADSQGQLSGSYHFTGRGDDPRTLHGAGALAIDHGNVFAIPFLGPLSGIVNAVLPGLGFDQAHQASANFLTAGGKIYTGNMDVKGVGFSLYGGGWLGYADDTMNFRVRINSRGLPGAVLYPVSKLLEYSSAGPLDKPIWRPRVLAGSEAKKPPVSSVPPPAASPAAPAPR